MRNTIKVLCAVFLLGTAGCPEPDVAKEAKEGPKAAEAEAGAPRTALSVIAQTKAALEANCGEGLSEIDVSELKGLELSADDLEKAEPMLQDIGLMARQCGDYSAPKLDAEAQAGCSPDCHWCPVKWYWCIENAGACAGGDNKACCKLGACGSKHHCKEVCESSCGCDVPPLPSDGGGGGDED